MIYSYVKSLITYYYILVPIFLCNQSDLMKEGVKSFENVKTTLLITYQRHVIWFGYPVSLTSFCINTLQTIAL